MSKHNFPMYNAMMERFEKGLCTKCGKKNFMNDRRMRLKDPLCPKCRKKYDEESRDWKSIIQDVLF